MRYTKLWIPLLLSITTNVSSLSNTINVTLLIYGNWPPYLVQCLPFMGPGFDLAVAEVKQIFVGSFNMDRVYVSSKSVNDCGDNGAYFTDVVEYYYQHSTAREQPDANNVIIFIYSGCDDSPTFAHLGRESNILVASCGTIFSRFRDRAVFPTTIEVGPVRYDLYATAILGLCTYYNWTTIGFVYDLSGLMPFNRWTYLYLIQYLKTYAPTIRVVSFPLQQNPYRYKEWDYDSLLDQIREKCRILFVSLPPWITRELTIRAYLRHQMSEDYVWFTVDLAEHSLGPVTWQRFEVDDQVARTAFEGLLQIINCWDYGPEIDSLRQEWRSRTTTDYNFTYPETNGPNEFTVTAYGLVHAIAQVINESIGFGENIKDAKLLTKRLQGREFNVPVIGAFRVDRNGERLTKVCINAVSSTTGQSERRLFWDFTSSKLKLVANTKIMWRTKTGEPPPSEPWCGFTGDGLRCRPSDTGQMVGIAAGIGATVILLGFALGIWLLLQETGVAQNCIHMARGRLLMAPAEQTVWVYNYEISPGGTFPDRRSRSVLHKLRGFSHPNVAALYGIIPMNHHLLFLSEFAEKGSLEDATMSSSLQDPELRSSLATDLIEGLYAIHQSPLKRHGSLRLSKCLVTNRFILKISGLAFEDTAGNIIIVNSGLESRMQIAPVVPKGTEYDVSSSASDIHALSIILRHLLPEYVFKDMSLSYYPSAQRGGPTTSPSFSDFQLLMTQCQHSDLSQRPTISTVRRFCQSSFGINSQNFTESVLLRLQKHAVLLETAVRERTQELMRETDANQALLCELLPRQTAARLRTERAVEPAYFESVSILFSYIVGFAEFVTENTDSPLAVLNFLNQLFLTFDDIVVLYDVYKVETINDCYMVASGLPESNGTRHAEELCKCALGFRQAFLQITTHTQQNLAVQMGLNTGSCVAGIVGTIRPRYCLFGDTVNTASRVASNNTEWTIQITRTTTDLIRDTALVTEYRGQVSLKGKGEVDIYCLMG